jgi:hypothetical protein
VGPHHAELDAVMQAARPIPIESRDAFLQDVAALLSGCVEVGPGTVHRAIQQAQKRHFNPPDLGRAPGVASKYR